MVSPRVRQGVMTDPLEGIGALGRRSTPPRRQACQQVHLPGEARGGNAQELLAGAQRVRDEFAQFRQAKRLR